MNDNRPPPWRRDQNRGARAFWSPEANRARSARMYSDPKRRAEILAANREWKRANKNRVRQTHERWLLTPNGRKHRTGLPVDAPTDLVQAMESLRALKRELKSK